MKLSSNVAKHARSVGPLKLEAAGERLDQANYRVEMRPPSNTIERFASFSVVCLYGMRGSDVAFCLEVKYI